MSNLNNFNNIYANLAESAYNNRPNKFTKYTKKIKETPFNYSENLLDKKGNVEVNGGINLANDGILYLQPDKTLHAENVSTNSYIFDNKFA